MIVGNGAAGNQAAASLRKYDSQCEIVMVDRESYMAYSACALPDVLAGWIPLGKTFLQQESDYSGLNIRTCFGQEVNEINLENQYLETGEEKYYYDRLILATGSKPVIPPLPGSQLPGNFVVKSPADIEQILLHKPRKVVVVGAGNIGVETAAAMNNRGCTVYLMEMQDRIMPLLYDPKPAAIIRSMLEKEGIQISTSQRATRVIGEQQVEGLLTEEQTLTCDTVIWAAGVRQNTELAQKAGLKIGSLGGIEVDKYMQTSHRWVYACGDCVQTSQVFTGKPALSLLWSSAKSQAEAAALNCLGQAVKYEGSCSLVIEEITGVPCAAIGLNLQGLQDYEVKVIEHHDADRYYRLLTVDDRIAGFQCIGSIEGAGAIFNLIRKGTTLSEVRRMLLNPQLISSMAWYIDGAKYL
jgi:NADH oxidase (H2O2-forming)